MRSIPSRTILLVASLGLASPATFAAAGKVLLVSGTAKIGSSSERTLQKGDALEVGDIISTDPGAKVQLLMADGARIVLQPGSSVRIDEFSMPSSVREPGATGADTSPGKSVATLLSGRIDASAGAIGAISFHTHGDVVTLTRQQPGFTTLDASGGLSPPPAIADVEQPPHLSMEAHSRFGLGVNLLQAQLPLLPQASTAISVPASTQPAFVAGTTERSDTLYFSSGGSLIQFNSEFGADPGAQPATYLSGNAALVDFGRNGSSGISWGRWSTGTASAATADGNQSLTLQNTSLHWITGPTFEAAPTLPTSGSVNFTLSGGTGPTDSQGRIGSLSAGVLSADFTAQKVTAQLSLDVNGYNWFASGTGALTAKTVLFNGTFGTVLVDGRVAGSGAFSGFLSAGPLTHDQLNGAGLSYWLSANQGPLGTVSGVAAFVPGSLVPLVPPLVERDVAYAAGGLSQRSLATGAAANSRTDLTLDARGNLTRFEAPLPRVPNGTLAIGVATNVNTGFDAATGIRWGRWEGGAIDFTAPSGSSQSHDLSSESLHWIAGNEFGAPPDLPLTGSATYTLIGNTDPTDTTGHTGTLGTASLTADFTNLTVDSRLTLSIDGRDWYARGHALFQLGGHRFNGTYDDVRIDNLAGGSGTISGFFTYPRIESGTVRGAGLAFNLADEADEIGVVSGVLAFAEGGTGAALTPAPMQERDISFVSPDVAPGSSFVTRASPVDYTLNSDFDVASMRGLANNGDPATYASGTSSIAESQASALLMLRWGRWAGGAATVTNLVDNSTYSIDLNHRSLHWIESADSASAPVMPLSGSATYALMGATSPTDRAGHTGVLNNASLSADFTHQVVNASLDVTINNVNVFATGNGAIGASAGLAAHQFSGAITGGAISSSQTTPQGSFSGFFSGPGGSQPGVPGGAGLTYTITDGQGGLTVDGAAAFRHP